MHFDGRTWTAEPGTVDRLGPDDTGVWLISTVGAQHVWDLDRRLFTRFPRLTSSAGRMPYDGTAQRITRVQTYPCIGSRLFIWFDEPSAGPALSEHYRISSTIVTIRRLLPEPRSGAGA
ncbi:hypothetical protein [Solicola sp. PLA-1-18]|uniref:hypothetical protein n=1 Tax=Solicola sp. PLA-1-18 TaxID=3380532 RepID=UPI003B7F4133